MPTVDLGKQIGASPLQESASGTAKFFLHVIRTEQEKECSSSRADMLISVRHRKRLS